MKSKNLNLIFLLFSLFTFSCKDAIEPPIPFVAVEGELPEYRNFFGICWHGNVNDNLAYAKQMGYGYVIYRYGMEKDPLSDNIYFYLESPEYNTYSRVVDTLKTYTATNINFYESYCALKNNGNFPGDLATGWFTSSHSFSVELDYQQNKVIVWAVDNILANVKAITSVNPKFHFGGFAWDVPDLSGDFWPAPQGNGSYQIGLSYWLGKDSSALKGSSVHDYLTYSDGKAEFYKTLFKATLEKYPNAKFINQPYTIYDSWIKKVKNRSDAKEIVSDMVIQENASTDFFDDSRIFDTGLIDREHLGSTLINFDEQSNRLAAAKVALNKSWFNFFGNFGKSDDATIYQNVQDVPQRLLLISVLPNWENMNNTPITDRKWNGTTYQSPNAYASDSVISVLQPKTNKLFFVFLKVDGVITLPAGKIVKNIYRTDGVFRETTDGTTDFIINNNTLKPASTLPLDNGYIIQFK